MTTISTTATTNFVTADDVTAVVKKGLLKAYAISLISKNTVIRGDIAEIAADLVSEAVCKVLEALDKGKEYEGGVSGAEALLKKTIQREYLNGCKSHNNSRRAGDSELMFSLIGDNGVGEKDADNADRLQVAIATLSEEYRVVMELRATGAQYEEIAEELRISLGTVKSRISRATKILRGVLVA
jgi:RNA polymerase sigma-70 factor (ECF subfamily)